MKLHILLVPQPLHPEHAHVYIYNSVDGLYARIINHQSFIPAVAVVVVVVVVVMVVVVVVVVVRWLTMGDGAGVVVVGVAGGHSLSGLHQHQHCGLVREVRPLLPSKRGSEGGRSVDCKSIVVRACVSVCVRA